MSSIENKMTEAEFSAWLIQHWFSGPRIHAQRIETSTGSGVPDMTVCLDGAEIWVETKVYYCGYTLLRPYQRAWMERRYCAGGTILIISHSPYERQVHVWKYGSCLTFIKFSQYLRIADKPHYRIDRCGMELSQLKNLFDLHP